MDNVTPIPLCEHKQRPDPLPFLKADIENIGLNGSEDLLQSLSQSSMTFEGLHLDPGFDLSLEEGVYRFVLSLKSHEPPAQISLQLGGETIKTFYPIHDAEEHCFSHTFAVVEVRSDFKVLVSTGIYGNLNISPTWENDRWDLKNVHKNFVLIECLAKTPDDREEYYEYQERAKVLVNNPVDLLGDLVSEVFCKLNDENHAKEVVEKALDSKLEEVRTQIDSLDHRAGNLVNGQSDLLNSYKAMVTRLTELEELAKKTSDRGHHYSAMLIDFAAKQLDDNDKLRKNLAGLELRLKKIEEEEVIVVEGEKPAVVDPKTVIERFLDDYKPLHQKGGHYVIENLQEDVPALVRQRVPFETIVKLVHQYAAERTRWWTLRYYWLEPVGQYTVIRRERVKNQRGPHGNKG